MISKRETLHISDDAGRIAMREIDLPKYTGDTDLEDPLTRYIYSNHLQSASLELDEDGDIISYEEYHPYGTTAYQANNAGINATAKRYRYTGKERDEESGLYYHGARYYIPWLCRWTAVDPLEAKFAGMSPYNYAFNNPVMWNDLSGASPGDESQQYNGRNIEHTQKIVDNTLYDVSLGYNASTGLNDIELFYQKSPYDDGGLTLNQQAESNSKGNFLGWGMSNNELALEWANQKHYGGYIKGDMLFYRTEDGSTVRNDEFGTPYRAHDMMYIDSIQINDKNFGIWGTWGNMTSSPSPLGNKANRESHNYSFDRVLRKNLGISSKEFNSELRTNLTFLAVGEALPNLSLPKFNKSSKTTSSRTFYTVQNTEDALRLRTTGTPWPTAPYRSHLGEGIYAWSEREIAEQYLSDGLKQGKANLEILSITVSERNFSSFNKAYLTEGLQAEKFIGNHSRLFGQGLSHNYDYIRGLTNNYAAEHYFNKSIFNKLKIN